MNWITTVWSIPGLLAAIVGGFAIGITMLRNQSVIFSLRLLVMLGSAFFAGQIVETLLSEPELAPRVMSRFLVWIVYSIAVGVGVWAAHRKS